MYFGFTLQIYKKIKNRSFPWRNIFIIKGRNMKISVVGTGYVGLVNGVCLAFNGHEVTCIDIDKKKIERLNNGMVPIYEEGLDEMFKTAREQGRLMFSGDYSSVSACDLVFICVGTPEGSDGSANLNYVFDAAEKIGKNIKKDALVVLKSTCPVGTTEKVKSVIEKIMLEEHNVWYAFNPEFLKEGVAVNDCLNPDRVVVGLENVEDRKSYAYRTMETLYSGKPVVFTGIKTAEMVKYASNAMLATRISFINEIANLCEKVGADVESVSKCVGMDNRIGPKFLNAGCGYGGSCFPKDVKALIRAGEESGVDMKVLKAVDSVNSLQKNVLYEKSKKYEFKTACILGLAFKPGTDDMREAPAVTLINQLLADGVEVVACDPVAIPTAMKIFGDKIKYQDIPYVAAEGADILFLVTEWEQFKKLDMIWINGVMRGNVLIDGRNIYNRKRMEDFGFIYERIG